MKTKTLIVSGMLLSLCGIASADDPPPATESPATPGATNNQRQGNTIGAAAPEAPSANSRPPAAAGFRGPLAPIGDVLGDAGFYPILFAGEWLITNPSGGVITDSHQWMTQLNMGFDFNLEPLLGLKGTSIHFVEAYIPHITPQLPTSNYFTQAGDVINASASAYLPENTHLARLTLEQQFLDKRVFIEGGKGYVNDYVARPDCLNAFMCMSTIAITHKASGFNFPNYSNWFARAGYQISPTMTVQGMWYEYDNNGSVSDGWEHWRETDYPAALVDFQYTAPKADMPASAEVLAYYNSIPQTDQTCGTCTKYTSNWQAGFLISGMATMWRPDVKKPRMLQAFLSFADTLNLNQTTSPSVGGLTYAMDVGLTLRSPFPWWSFDSYSVQLTTVELTKDEQRYLEAQGYGAPGRQEYSLGATATFRPFDVLFISPYVERLINANAAFAANDFTNPNHVQPQDGWGFGLTLAIPLGQALGLTTKRSGYDGHYP